MEDRRKIQCSPFAKSPSSLGRNIPDNPFMKVRSRPLVSTVLPFLALLGGLTNASAEYPMKRPARSSPAAAEGSYTVHPDKPRQVIKGFGFEIQSDSIGSANRGLPEDFIGVPHDLVPSERKRFATEMLKGFRYCRLAGGLYWRGLDADGKFFQGRWPGQLPELKEMLTTAGVEGVSLEYWSPAPFWKANNSLVGPKKETNLLRCYGPDFATDPVYKGDTERFFKDFSDALVHDIRHLRENGIPVLMWGLQNEPRAGNCGLDYSRCGYTLDQYVTAFRAVAPAIRAHDPGIKIIADTWELKYVEPLMRDPATRGLIDALVLHHVGSDANVVPPTVARARAKFGNEKPLFQNEYEYLAGPTTPDRCLNTVLHIMNWFQIGEAPTWFWIHALKPIGNAEASGYSLGSGAGVMTNRPATTRSSPDSNAATGHGTNTTGMQSVALSTTCPGTRKGSLWMKRTGTMTCASLHLRSRTGN